MLVTLAAYGEAGIDALALASYLQIEGAKNFGSSREDFAAQAFRLTFYREQVIWSFGLGHPSNGGVATDSFATSHAREKFGAAVGRRTAERLRDSLAAMFPQMECWDDDERVRRWRLPGSVLVGVVEPRPEAVAAIEISARECAMRGEGDRAALLREASTTLKVVMRPDALRRAEPDIAALMEAEGIAMRPGPRPVIAEGVLPALRRAILGMQLVVVRYAGPDADKPAARIVCPYGILYGGRGWLVAHVDELPEMRLWRLDRVVSVDLVDRGFARREDFDLAAYAAQSFGVFQEEPIDVVLRFEPERRPDLGHYHFRRPAWHRSLGYRAAGRHQYGVPRRTERDRLDWE